MSKEDTGGRAFPTNESNYNVNWSCPGMTLRDYFAAKAMQSLIPGVVDEGTPRWKDNIEAAAMDSYSYADAMLEVRKK